MDINAIAVGLIPPYDINDVIEVSVGGGPIKHGLDKAAGTLVVDGFLCRPMRYPINFGLVPRTRSDDGDSVDVMVCNVRAIMPGAVVNCRPVGVLMMEDDGGHDEKIIAVPSAHLSQRYVNVHDDSDLASITFD